MFALRVGAGAMGKREEAHLKALRDIYFDDDCGAASDGGACYGELLENENYAKEDFFSGLISLALDVRSIAGVDSCSIHPRRGHIFCEHRL